MHSANACALFKETGMKFDMIFIDGDHTYEGCKSDILNTVDLLEPDGILCGHDYITWPGVKQAVDELVGKVSLSNSIWTKQSGVPCIAGKKRVFDCFLFHDELELLEIRLNELDPVVDKFIIIESAITHSGNTKPFYFEENKERFAKFLPKIQYVKLDSLPGDEKVILNGLPNGATWVKERYQRDTIKQYVDGNDNDVVIVTDMDEIPNVEAVRNYKPEMGLRYFDMKLYCYWLNCYSGLWDQAKIIGYKDFKNMTPCFIRYTNCPKLDNGGWHFSFQGGVDRVLKKIVSWAHSEYNLPQIANKEWITEAINAPKDVLRRKDVALEFVKIDSTFPKYIVDNIDRYKADGWIKEF
jgi:beta-1,4-mannosyl-glycoprotein beta-1,4-N-acetylglucosaminyltransferase